MIGYHFEEVSVILFGVGLDEIIQECLSCLKYLLALILLTHMCYLSWVCENEYVLEQLIHL